MIGTLAVSLEGKLLGKGILELSLLHVHEVGRQVVNIHQHIVLEELIGCRGVEIEIVSTEGKVQSRIEEVAAIVALSVGRGVFRLPCAFIQNAVWKSVLLDILVICDVVDVPSVGGLEYQSKPSTRLVIFIGTVASGLILEKAVLSIVECSERKGNLVAQLAVMRQFGIAVERRAHA